MIENGVFIKDVQFLQLYSKSWPHTGRVLEYFFYPQFFTRSWGEAYLPPIFECLKIPKFFIDYPNTPISSSNIQNPPIFSSKNLKSPNFFFSKNQNPTIFSKNVQNLQKIFFNYPKSPIFSSNIQNPPIFPSNIQNPPIFS